MLHRFNNSDKNHLIKVLVSLYTFLIVVKAISFLDYKCPYCGNTGFHRHGFYTRNYILYDSSCLTVEILRIKCSKCGKTLSVVPNIHVYRQRTTLFTCWELIECINSKHVYRVAESLDYRDARSFLRLRKKLLQEKQKLLDAMLNTLDILLDILDLTSSDAFPTEYVDVIRKFRIYHTCAQTS